MATDVSVRPATGRDAPALARMRYEFRAVLGAPAEDEATFVARCEAWMAERLREGTQWRAWVAEGGAGELLGTAWVGLVEKMPNPAPEPEEHAYVTNVYVRAEARRRGVGSALLDAALGWCAARGVHAAVLWPTVKSAPLYRRHGFAAPRALLERTFAEGPDRGYPPAPA